MMRYRCPLFLQLLILILKWLTSASASEQAPETNTANPSCMPMCGNISIPYPFGIGNGCHIEEKWFSLTCKNEKLYFQKSSYNDTEVLELSYDGQLRVNTSLATNWVCYDSFGNVTNSFHTVTKSSRRIGVYTFDEDIPFTLTHGRNKLTGIGCDTEALIATSLGNNSRATGTGCISVCFDDTILSEQPCTGVGCCQAEIPPRIKRFGVFVGSSGATRNVLNFSPCSYAFLIDKNHNLNSSTVSDLLHSKRCPEDLKFPVALHWTIGKQTCVEAQKNPQKYACKSINSVCNESRSGDSRHGSGYRCSCRDGYGGNPYLESGCKDIDECLKKIDNCTAKEKCVNTPGAFSCETLSNKGTRTTVILSVILSLSCIFTVSSWIFWGVKKRKLIKLKEKYFLKNGGMLLQQQIRTHGVTVATKVFSAEELRKATNNYDEERIVGRGGYGTVYKGILADSTVVAIKKSKIVDENQIEQFINEVFILSQIVHKNVVKLLGCCLETEVPLLVYEFIFNGTLFSHIHDEACISSLSCETRLRIASETAEALSYLHSAAAIPIFHRDVKSTNILLDDNLTAKVSDFGASRLVPVDQTRITTLVQGTIGYLDPEYFLTGQLTEKSDVYSFGVVLVELLTGEKPTSATRNGNDSNLAMYFLSSMRENHLFQILDNRVVVEGDVEQLVAITQLAKRCLSVKGEERPTMKEIAAELERLRRFIEQPQMEREDGAILSEVGDVGEQNSSMSALLVDVDG